LKAAAEAEVLDDAHECSVAEMQRMQRWRAAQRSRNRKAE